MNEDREVKIIRGDLSKNEHVEHFVRLTSEFMADEMGGKISWTKDQKDKVVNDMRIHPCSIILFAIVNGKYAGLCTCFFAYSTFLAKPLLNIHDIYIEESLRGHGIGKKMVKAVEGVAERNNCGKITLEVRKDNLNARDLYKSQGFTEAPCSRFFWVKKI